MILAYILAGLVGGIVSGMGMGGGTLLIPLLILFLGLEQHIAQAVNLLVFIPTGIVALIIHAKNKLINFRVSLCVAIPAIIVAILSAILVGRIESGVLRIIFAIFLIIIGIFELYKAIVSVVKRRKPVLKSKEHFLAHTPCNKKCFFIKQ